MFPVLDQPSTSEFAVFNLRSFSRYDKAKPKASCVARMSLLDIVLLFLQVSTPFNLAEPLIPRPAKVNTEHKLIVYKGSKMTQLHGEEERCPAYGNLRNTPQITTAANRTGPRKADKSPSKA
ncbi:hypothetical protein N7453_001565 [Penicillium expansum]|nr:hypothetical protein N7453_001565 [Penicillium expansum]